MATVLRILLQKPCVFHNSNMAHGRAPRETDSTPSLARRRSAAQEARGDSSRPEEDGNPQNLGLSSSSARPCLSPPPLLGTGSAQADPMLISSSAQAQAWLSSTPAPASETFGGLRWPKVANPSWLLRYLFGIQRCSIECSES